MIEERVRAALREIADATPVHPDVEAAMVTSPAAAPRWRHLAPSLAAASVLAIVLTVIVVRVPSGVEQPGASSGPTLPDRFPAFSFVQGVTDGRFGRAIALYVNGSGHEDFTFSQLMLAGADSDTYRRLEVPEYSNGGGLVRARLSPDGTKVAIGGNGITLLDLTTGDRKHHPVALPDNVMPLAFSPNGRHVAYLSSPDMGGPGPLSILDIVTWSSTVIVNEEVWTAAFSPDGSRMAYQISHPPTEEIGLRRLDGTPDGRIALPARTRLAGPLAWSPDGRFLVAIASIPDPNRSVAVLKPGDYQSYVFLDANGATASAFTPIPAEELVPRAWGEAVIGWRSPTRMLVSAGDVDGTTSNLIAEVDLTNGSSQVISRFAVGDNDDLAVGDVQLATALLTETGIRHSTDPDRGPWPTWAIVTSIACLLPVVALTVLWWVRRRKALA